MKAEKIVLTFGTRPEAIKMAPVVKVLENDFKTIVAVTAQHRDMLDQVLEVFEIRPDYDLNIMTENQSLSQVTSRVLLGMEEVIEKERPDLILVHGDTTTTFASSLAGFYQKIAIGHVEAGLRTHNKYSPFPEEINRTLTAVLSDLHFAPTSSARENLLKEGVDPQKIYVTGNTVIDALLMTVEENYKFYPPLDRVDFSKKVILVTAHRRENWGDKLRNAFLAMRDLVDNFEDIIIIYPVHPNPNVKKPAYQILGDVPRIFLIDPLDYKDFANLLARVYLVLTDSGGLQEEAPALGKPVLVMRDTTERPEAVEAGTVKVIGTDRQNVYRETARLLTNKTLYEQMAKAINPYGDGKASLRIKKALLDLSSQKAVRMR